MGIDGASVPQPARVSIDGSLVGETPHRYVLAGRHVLRVEADATIPTCGGSRLPDTTLEVRARARRQHVEFRSADGRLSS
jgi:hypothetical protein